MCNKKMQVLFPTLEQRSLILYFLSLVNDLLVLTAR